MLINWLLKRGRSNARSVHSAVFRRSTRADIWPGSRFLYLTWRSDLEGGYRNVTPNGDSHHRFENFATVYTYDEHAEDSARVLNAIFRPATLPRQTGDARPSLNIPGRFGREAAMKVVAFGRRPFLPLLVLFAIVLEGCGGKSTPTSQLPVYYPAGTQVPVSGPSVDGAQAFDTAVTALLKKWNIPGAALAITKNGKLVLARGYGYADFEDKQFMQPDSMFRIGSSTKVLTAMAILHLQEQGLLNIDMNFLDVLTQYRVAPGGDQRINHITIRDLLRHSGGWDRDLSGDPMSWQGTISRALGISMPVLCPDVIRYMMGQPLDFAPGTKQVYSNFGYCILGRVIEKVSGQPYEIYVRNEVLKPMNIQGMSIGYSESLSQRGPKEVRYYEYEGAPLADSVFPGGGKVPGSYGGFEIQELDSCGGWLGSPVDLTRAMTAVDGSRTGPYLQPETLAEYVADPGLPDWNTDQSYWYGLGIFVGPNPQTWYHGGTINGTKSEWLRDGNGYSWSIMTNSISSDPGMLGNELDAAVIQGLSSGFTGSATDLFPQFPSPSLPSRTSK